MSSLNGSVSRRLMTNSIIFDIRIYEEENYREYKESFLSINEIGASNMKGEHELLWSIRF